MKRMRAELLHAAVTMIFLAGAGCATKLLDSPRASPGQRANIRARSAFSLKGGATLAAIDGETLLFENSADILPGPHVARVCYEWPLSSYLKCEDLPFMAEAGHTYVVCGDSRGYLESRYYLWIVDERTQRVVAGGKP